MAGERLRGAALSPVWGGETEAEAEADACVLTDRHSARPAALLLVGEGVGGEGCPHSLHSPSYFVKPHKDRGTVARGLKAR